MTERILHHFPLDPASRQVRLALGEKRLPFTEQTVRYWEQPDAFLDLNPSGVTPVMVEDGLVLCESRTILDHLEETCPEPPLLGRDPEERAEARRLVLWFDRKFDLEVAGYLLHEKMEKRLLGLGAPTSPPCARDARLCVITCPTSRPCFRPGTGWPDAACPWRTSPQPPTCRSSTISATSRGTASRA